MEQELPLNKFCAKCGKPVQSTKFCGVCGKFSAPGANDDIDLTGFTAVQLAAVKKDLEQRLARFQRAFFERTGRNPNDAEREPAKPAIRRYRAVCQELGRRESVMRSQQQAAAQPTGPTGVEIVASADDSDAKWQAMKKRGEATRVRGQGESRGPGVAIAEQVVTQVQVAPGSDAVREATRGAGAAVASSTSASTLEKITSIMRMVTPSAAMCDLLVSWGQFTAIFGDLTQQVTHELGRDFPNFLIPNWATQLDGIWPVVKVFNLDIRALQAHLDFAFLAAIGWRETHLAFTVLVPLIISGVTIVLLRSLADIARLILFTLSVLLLVFGAAAYAILGLASSTRGEETTEILDLNTTVLAYVMVTGGCGLFLSIVLFFYRAHVTHQKIRAYLQNEVDDLAEKLYGVKEGLQSATVNVQQAPRPSHASAPGAAPPMVGRLSIQEALPNASALTSILEDDDDDHDEHMVGGRAKDASEFLRQMHDRANKRKHGHGPRMPAFSSFIKTLVVWLVLSLGALFFWLRYAEMLPASVLEALPETYSTTYHVLAIACSILSGVILIYELLTLTQNGQIFLDSTFQLLKAVYIGFLMIVVSMLYIPISRQALSVFVCKKQECLQGEWYPLQSPGSESTLWSYVTQFASSYVDAVNAIGGTNGTDNAGDDALLTMRPAESCQPCSFLGAPRVNSGGSSCPADLTTELCPPSQSLRLTAAPQIDCNQQWVFYIPGVLLTLCMITVGVPYMFYNLTHRHVAMYESLDIYEKNKAEEKKQKQMARRGIFKHAEKEYNPHELDDLWRRRVRRAVRNRAKNLYSDFQYKWRYWKLVVMGFKFLIVFVPFVVDLLQARGVHHVTLTPILMLVIHAAMFLLSLYAHPYIDKRPDMLSIAISFANVFNWCLLLTTAMRIRSPNFIIYIVLTVNIIVPILSLFLGWYLNVRRDRKLTGALNAKTNKRKYLTIQLVQKKRRMIERKINEFTLRVLASWTWMLLITTLIAGELIFIGTFAEAALTPVSGHTSSRLETRDDIVMCYREEYARNQEFLSFGNWSSFTQNCCCMSRSNVTNPSYLDEHIFELWSCSNKNAATELERRERPIIYKERQRRPLLPGTAVAPVRGFCDPVFRDQDGNEVADLEPQFDEASGKLGIYWRDASGEVVQFWDDYW